MYVCVWCGMQTVVSIYVHIDVKNEHKQANKQKECK